MAETPTIGVTPVADKRTAALPNLGSVKCFAGNEASYAAGVCGPSSGTPMEVNRSARPSGRPELVAEVRAQNRTQFRATVLEMLQRDPRMTRILTAMERHGESLTPDRAADIITRRAFHGRADNESITAPVFTNIGELASIGDRTRAGTGGPDERRLGTAFALAERSRTGDSAAALARRVDGAATRMGLTGSGRYDSAAVRSSIYDTESYDMSEVADAADDPSLANPTYAQVTPSNDQYERAAVAGSGRVITGGVSEALHAEGDYIHRDATARDDARWQINQRVAAGALGVPRNAKHIGVMLRPYRAT